MVVDDEDQQYCGLEGIDAPLIRTVEAKTGAVFRPPTMAAALQLLDEAVRQRDKAIGDRDDAIASRDNMVNFAIEVGRLGGYLKDALAEVDEFRGLYLEYRDKFEAAQCRVQELEQP